MSTYIITESSNDDSDEKIISEFIAYNQIEAAIDTCRKIANNYIKSYINDDFKIETIDNSNNTFEPVIINVINDDEIVHQFQVTQLTVQA